MRIPSGAARSLNLQDNGVRKQSQRDLKGNTWAVAPYGLRRSRNPLRATRQRFTSVRCEESPGKSRYARRVPRVAKCGSGAAGVRGGAVAHDRP